jgi:hypothetical protein
MYVYIFNRMTSSKTYAFEAYGSSIQCLQESGIFCNTLQKFNLAPSRIICVASDNGDTVTNKIDHFLDWKCSPLSGWNNMYIVPHCTKDAGVFVTQNMRCVARLDASMLENNFVFVCFICIAMSLLVCCIAIGTGVVCTYHVFKASRKK